MRLNFIFTFYLFILAWLLVGVYCMHTAPATFWPVGFIALSLPVPLLLNLGFLVFWLFGRSVRVVMPIVVLVLTWSFYGRVFSLNLFPAKANTADISLTVLSYNVRIFNVYEHLRPDGYESSIAGINWVKNYPADIFCLQEFYNEPGHKIYNAVDRIWKGRGKYAFVSKSLVNHAGGQFGLAIFSKYPIVQKGSIKFGKLTQNHGMFADLKIGNDTIRVYNFHLQSMSIDEKEIVGSYSGQSQEKMMRVKQLGNRLKKGFVKRSGQVDTLVAHIQACKYPVIIGCDMNDTPFSYSYDKINNLLHNAFTHAGNGFGSTYNGPIPFLRIDNQFYSDDFTVTEFNVHSEVPYSDHFPISATYILNKK